MIRIEACGQSDEVEDVRACGDTITLPEMVYEQIRQAAERSHRPVEDVLAEAVAAAAPVMDTPPGTLRSALAHLAYLNDAALWQAARTTMTAEQRERLATLHDK